MTRKKRCGRATAAAILLSIALPSPAGAEGARVKVDCAMEGTTMVVTMSALTRGGGKPQPIPEAKAVGIFVDQKIGKDFQRVAGTLALGTTPLPVTGRVQLCLSGRPVYSASATALRGRGTANLLSLGYIGKSCSPKKPPACR